MLTKSKFKTIAVLACIILVMLALFCIGNAEADAATYSGNCGAEGDGSNLQWSLDTDTGVLEITGNGAMKDYSSSPSNRSPWYSSVSYVKVVNIGNSVSSIGDYALSSCYNLKRITIPNSVTRVGERAFFGCYNATGLTIGDGVTSIGDYAFSYCSYLKNITVSTNNQAYKLIDGNLYSKDGKTLILYAVGKDAISFTLPDGVTSIGVAAFYGSKLTSVNMGDSITEIGERAFYECSDLKSIIIPDSVMSIGVAAFYNCYDMTSVSIGGSVTSISAYAFAECESLTGITIPDSVKSIGEYAFGECGSLTGIAIPDSVTSIGDYAFYVCYSMTDVTIGSGVTSIGFSAFAECESLKSVIFKATDCWRVATSSEAKNGTEIDISEPSVAKEHLTSAYAEYYWYHHNYTAVTVDPTCTTDGYTTYTCSECDYGYTEVQNALGHRYESVVTAPTCSDGGYTMYTCICGDSYVDNRTEKLDHSYGDDGVCESCGAKAPDAGNNSNGNVGSDNGNGNGGSNNNGSSSKGGCGGSTGMYISYLFTVLIPASFVFLGKFLFL